MFLADLSNLRRRPQPFVSTAMPYTGGDIKKSGELGKMFDLHVEKSRKSGPLGSAPSRNTSFGGAASKLRTSRAKSNSGPLNKHGEPTKRSSGPQSGGVTPMARNSGPLPPVLPTTGLITSGPISSGPLNSSGAPRKVSGPLDSAASMKLRATSFAHNQAVTNLNAEDGYSIQGSFPKPILWAVILLFVMGFIAGGFILGAVHNAILLIVVCGDICFCAALLIWNACWEEEAPLGLLIAILMLISELPKMDNFQSGLRALVKTGYGARVTPYVDESVIIDINTDNKDMSPEFLRWLRERNLSSDDRIMRLKEGYIKEGSTVSVMGVVQRNDNVLMIVSPSEPISTGCQWGKCVLPTNIDGLVLRCEDTSNIDVIPV
ncbi:hypothetical protein HU200_010787 [Digitaria exilis]|uniref:Ubiquitin-specific protease family C19-related protein n=1 Tax=Digitaria exilis TaxID=1010633 RepID=A0A835FHR2_9POAL|nr:hypothetical protein HU200_010787 [Digitaria exilis]